MCLYVCVCVCDRERGREGKRVCVSVCVSVTERERKREKSREIKRHFDVATCSAKRDSDQLMLLSEGGGDLRGAMHLIAALRFSELPLNSARRGWPGTTEKTRHTVRSFDQTKCTDQTGGPRRLFLQRFNFLAFKQSQQT